MDVALVTPHAELVFHVLAHVPAPPGGAPASLYDAAYAAWAEGHLGPAAQRPLGQDVAVLARRQTHASAIRLQRYARVFAAPEAARVYATAPLSEVPASALDRVDQRDAILPSDDALEVLRCAVALELEAWRKLPPVSLPDDLARALSPLAALAPKLRTLSLSVVRSLGTRGRLWDDEIWIGLPDARTSRHEVAWQAAHEATLAEVWEAEPSLGEDAAERLSLALLAVRVIDCAPRYREDHAAWWARYGGKPSLSTREREVLRRLRSVT